jgi:SAM-dependent methyltransferase
MSSATDHDWYADLAAQNYAMLPGFDDRQVEAAQEIFETLMPHIQKGALEIIVDLGCGSGEVLVDLARRLSARRLNFGEAKSILLIGLDPSAALIRKADEDLQKVDLASSVACLFARCDDPSTLPLDQLDTLLRSQNKTFASTSERMAVLCLGHTIFHLLYLDDLFETLDASAPIRPLMFIVDVYHSWDSTIEELRTSDKVAVAEPRSFIENGSGEKVLNVLFTRWAEASGRKEVERGLVQALDMDLRGEEVIVTRQLARTSGEMVAAFVKGRYLLAQKTASHSGYGEMNRFTFQRSMRSFPLPALFLDSKAVPSLASIRGDNPAVHASPLHILARWMDESGFIEPPTPQYSQNGASGHGGGFDFAIVETSPWYNSKDGLRALRLELLVCARAAEPEGEKGVGRSLTSQLLHGADVDSLSKALFEYRDTLLRLQGLDIGAFLHPRFAGYDGVNEWAHAHFSHLEGRSPELQFVEGGERDRYGRWRAALDLVATPGGRDDAVLPDVPHTSSNVKALVESSSISDFVDSLQGKMKTYDGRLLKDHRPDADATETFKNIDLGILTRDLDMVHILLHERLRLALGLDQEGSMISSVLLGIPLRVLPDKFENPDQLLPDRHRGGVWVFAGKFGDFGPKQNAMLGDLARLAVLLSNTAIDAKAADALMSHQRDASRKWYERVIFANSQEKWVAAETKIDTGKFFASGSGHHSEDAWKLLFEAEGGLLPNLMVMAEQMIQLSKELLTDCTDLEFELDFMTAVSLLHGICDNADTVSASAVVIVLQRAPGTFVGEFSQFSRQNIRCAHDVGGGRLLRAIHQLAWSVPKKGCITHKSVTFAPDGDSSGICSIHFQSAFSDEAARDNAIKHLQMEPDIRMHILDRSKERGPGEGNEAFYWLARATAIARDPATSKFGSGAKRVKVDPQGELCLSVTFELPCDYPEGVV